MIQQGYITFVNMYACNISAPKYRMQLLTDIKREIGSYIVTVGDFNIPFSLMDRSSEQKINKTTVALKDILNQI